MNTTARLRKAINWLIYQEVAENERALADLLGYTKSSFSQLVNGKVPLSEKFVKKLCRLDENINDVWIMTGEGKLFKEPPSDEPISEKTISIPVSVWETVQSQAASLATRDRQLDRMIDLLQQQIEEVKKMDAHMGDDATSAAVG